jgi:hypothetical protein
MRRGGTDSATRSSRHLGFCVPAVLLGLAFASEASGQETATRQYLAPTVFQQGATLVLQGAQEGQTRLIEAGFSAVSTPSGQRVALFRGSSDLGQEVIVLGAAADELLHRNFPRGRDVFLSEGGLVTLARPAHAGGRVHEVRFFSDRGETLGSAVAEGLVIEDFSLLASGRLVTLSRGPTPSSVTVIIYDERGEVLRRHEIPDAALDAGLPLAHLTGDRERLALVRWRDLLSQKVELELLDGEGRRLTIHRLPMIDQLVSSDDSRLIAAVGPKTLLLLDARDGRVLWRHDEPLDTVALDGLFFDEAAGRLLVFTGRLDPAAGRRLVQARSARLSDGAVTTLTLGEQPSDEDLLVIGLRSGAEGVQEVVLPGRILPLPSRQAGAP